MQRSRRTHLPQALASVVSLASLLSYVPASGAQQASQRAVPVRYAVLDYMRVTPGKGDEYVRLERQVWKQFHEDRIRNKRMVAWGLYAVPYTADVERQYDYVTVNIYDSFGAIDQGTELQAMFRRVHAGKDPDRLLAQTGEARRVVKSEVWRLVDETTPAAAPAAPTRYLVLDYMRSKPNVDYVAVERELWKPVHQERVRTGALNDWGLWQLVLPGGTAYPYNYATSNSMSSLAPIQDVNAADLFRRVLPNVSLETVTNRTGAARDLTRRELWVLVDGAP